MASLAEAVSLCYNRAMAKGFDWKHHLVWMGILLLYAMSLPLIALEFTKTGGHPNQRMLGAELLLVGWLGVFVLQFAWLANIIWLVSILGVIFRFPLLAALPALLAIGASLQTLMLFGMDIPGDEGGVTKMRLIALGPGAYIWWAALGAPLLWALVAILFTRRLGPPPRQPAMT